MEDKAKLEEPFLYEDIRDVVWNNDGSNNPRLDGYNFGFLKKCWNSLKEYLVKFVNEFHINDKLPKEIATSFITLVLKPKNPQELSKYMPISLVE